MFQDLISIWLIMIHWWIYIQAEYQIYTVVSWLLAKWRKNLNCFKSLTVPKISLLFFKVKIVIYRSKNQSLILKFKYLLWRFIVTTWSPGGQRHWKSQTVFTCWSDAIPRIGHLNASSMISAFIQLASTTVSNLEIYPSGAICHN